MHLADSLAAYCLAPLACWILLSGADDVFLDLVCLFTWLANRSIFRRVDQQAEEAEVLSAPQKRCAIFVPCWHEDTVITQMVMNNLSRVTYSNFDFFLGVYPNDLPTTQEAAALAQRFPRVHVAMCPHDGPTSKADCLNWIYQRMMDFEREHGCRFDIVMTHDAEDVIHPSALHWINYYIDAYDMVQVPVLPLPTPWSDFTHGVYCDEFAEFQTKDMPGRQILGGFIPSNGVGTGFSRWALDKLAEDRGRIFQPECLTEDYENGLRLHLLGCPQLFMPIRMRDGDPVATREYFPRTCRMAIRQRTRWMTGIALQTWERHGWRGGIGTVYWLWRDRKGLIGNPVSMITLLMFAYGSVTWCQSVTTGSPWGLAGAADGPVMGWLLSITSALQFVHLGVRAWCTARIYGWRFAALVPLRAMFANYINFRATAGAIRRYAASRWFHRPLVWLKTAHTYPTGQADATPATLAEILITGGLLQASDLEAAAAAKPPEIALHEYLLSRGMLEETRLYEMLSILVRIPLTRIESRRIRRRVARALPRHVMERWRVVPFQVSGGHLFVASPDPPGKPLLEQLQRFTRLALRFHLITPANFERLRRELF